MLWVNRPIHNFTLMNVERPLHILVTGACGQLGTELVRDLRAMVADMLYNLTLN